MTNTAARKVIAKGTRVRGTRADGSTVEGVTANVTSAVAVRVLIRPDGQAVGFAPVARDRVEVLA
jgi:hypothetical protein